MKKTKTQLMQEAWDKYTKENKGFHHLKRDVFREGFYAGWIAHETDQKRDLAWNECQSKFTRNEGQDRIKN